MFRHLRSLSSPTFAVCLGFVSGTCLAGDIVILCGQSNASGRVSQGYEALPGDAAIPFHYDTDGPVWFRASSAGWTTLHPIPETGVYGPEIAMGRHLAGAGWAPCVIKVSRGSTSLAENWHNNDGGGEMWDLWQSEVRDALGSLEADGATIRAIVWMQGENDATRLEWSDSYAANLKKLRGDMLQYLASLGWNSSSTLFVCGRVLDNQPHSAEVRLAQTQQEVAVDTDDLNTLDGVHYDADSVAVLGTRFADAILAGTGTRLLDYALVAKPDPGGVLIRWRCPLDTTIALETTADFLTWAPLVSEQVRVSVRMREINAADSMQVFRLSVR
ncbi:MAG: hypothetical protein H7A46_24530 [Verrucomicrobiales bacterium]|nr:hypothetical protein [Verrucomicrobiales bacterium]